MNKKQLIVLWVMVGAICFIIFTAPKVMNPLKSKGVMQDGSYGFGGHSPSTDWDYVARYSIPTLLIGFSIILTLRTKKK